MRGLRRTLISIALVAIAGCGDDGEPAEIYEPCTSDGECTSRRCERVAAESDPTSTVRLCTTICGGSSDCPSTVGGRAGVCASVGDSPFVCWAPCEGDRDCERGFECGLVDGERICVPAADPSLERDF